MPNLRIPRQRPRPRCKAHRTRIRSKLPSTSFASAASATAHLTRSAYAYRRSRASHLRQPLRTHIRRQHLRRPPAARASISVFPPGAAQQSQTRLPPPASQPPQAPPPAAIHHPSCGSTRHRASDKHPALASSFWSASQIFNAASRPYAATHRSTIHSGCPNRSANAAVDS